MKETMMGVQMDMAGGHQYPPGSRFILHIQVGKSHNSKYEDAEPTQHRYSTAATASASTGGRAKKTQKVTVAEHFILQL